MALLTSQFLKRSVFAIACAISVTPTAVFAELPAEMRDNWRESFTGGTCSGGTAPYWYDHSVLSASSPARPIMKIGDMQAWATVDDNGNKQLALTTPDGLTIYGRVVGPQGEDISGALLATVPMARTSGVATNSAVPDGTSAGPTALPGGTAAALAQPSLPVTAPSSAPTPAAPVPTTTPSATAASPAPIATPTATTTVAANDNQRDALATRIMEAMPQKADTLDQLLVQASQFSAWFNLGEPKPGAPTVYLFADPTCPYCSEAVRQLKPAIDTGDVDVRIILAPILSKDSFVQAVSIVQSGDPDAAFVQHAVGQYGSEGSKLTILPQESFDENVTMAMLRNVYWVRHNEVRAVPFWLYKTADGVQYGQGPWDPAILQKAVALPMGPIATASTADAGTTAPTDVTAAAPQAAPQAASQPTIPTAPATSAAAAVPVLGGIAQESTAPWAQPTQSVEVQQ